MKTKLEYIWLDGYEPTPNLRSKTKIVAFDGEPTLEDVPVWNFDGSSTRQAEGSSSDCFLQPVALFPDPARANAMLVMCEVLLPDGTAHPSNSRASIPDLSICFTIRCGCPVAATPGSVITSTRATSYVERSYPISSEAPAPNLSCGAP